MLALLALLTLVPQGLELRGVVQAKDGRLLAGATVFVATARPRRGVGVL